MDCFSFSTDRAPNWKWQRVQGIRDGSQPESTAALDTQKGSYWINHTLEFLESYDRESSPLKNTELITLYGDIYQAYRIYIDEESLFKWELEASVLANVEPTEIAVSVGSPESVIIAYEELFFDVRERLDKPAYIRNYVIGQDVQSLQYNDYDKLWKHYAYDNGGYEVLKALIRRTINPPVCTTPEMVQEQLERDISDSVRLQASAVSKNLSKAYREKGGIIDAAIELMKLDKMEDASGGGATGDILKHIEALFDQLPWRVGGSDPIEKKMDKPNAVSRYMSTPVELKLNEVVDASITGETAEAEELLDIKYPPIPIKKKLK